MRDSFALFIESPWQWVSLGLGGVLRTNLIRGEIEATGRLLGIETTPGIFADLRVMEAEAIRVWSRKR